ncbi:MAG: tetratricopeptide (TPR) repeat protein [Verrucomicrobiales bacterium]
MKFRVLVLFLFSLALLSSGNGQEAAGPNDKAERYHKALLRRPAPGYLFDRFYDSWLDSGGVEELSAFLVARAEEPDADAAEQLLLAFFYAKQGEDEDALAVFTAVLEREPNHAAAWFQKAKIEARSLNFESAIADLDAAAAAGANAELEIDIAKFKGQLLTRDGKKESAIEVWESLLAQNPDDEELHEDLIELQLDEGLYEEAAATSRALIKRTTDPYSRVLRELRLGDVQQRAGEREAALELYLGTLKQTGAETWIEREVLGQIEELFRREDDLDGLLEEFQFLQTADPQRMAVRRRRAELLAEQGLEEESIAAWKEILDLTPGDRVIREAFVRSLAMAGHVEEAVEQMQALADLNPDDAELLVVLAGFQAQNEDGKAAGASMTAYLEKAGKSEYSFLRTTRLLQMFELPEQAESVYQQLLAAFPDSIAAKENFAAFLFDLERPAEALEIWKDLAESGDAAQAVRIARTLTSRREFAVAFETLFSRYEELGAEPIFLSQLCESAIHAEKAEQAFEWARRRVILSRDPLDLTESVKLAARVVRMSNEGAARIAELQANADRGIRETCLLAELLEEDGFPGEAEALLAGIEGEDAVLALAQLVRLYQSRGNWELAAETQEKLIQLPGGKNSAQIQALVRMHERNLDFAEAARWIGEWQKLSPGSVSPWLRLANLQSVDGEFEEAVKTLRSASQRFDDSPEIRAKLADSYFSLGKLASSERLYWRLYEEEKDSAGKIIWVRKLASVAGQLDQLDRLIAEFEERRRGNRTSILPLLALAEIHQENGNYEERRQAILEAARLQPKDLGLMHQLARIDEDAGRIDAAIRTLESALANDPTNRTREKLARLHFTMGDFDRGLATMREGGGATDPEQLLSAAQQLCTVGAWERAAGFLAPFLDEHPDDYRLFYLRAVALEEAGEKDRAAAAFEQLLGFEQDIPGFDQHVVEVQRDYGQAHATIRKLGQDELLSQLLRRKAEARYPPETLEISEILDADWLAYNYRQGRDEGRIYGFQANPSYGHHFSYRARSTTTTMVIAQPLKAADARSFAIRHLHRIAGEDEDRLLTLREALKAQGLPDRAIQLLEIEQKIENSTNNDEELAQEISAFLLENQGDPIISALWLRRWSESFPETKLVANAIEVFDESQPLLAIQAGLSPTPIYRKTDKAEVRPLVAKVLPFLLAIDPEQLLPKDVEMVADFVRADLYLQVESNPVDPFASLGGRAFEPGPAEEKTVNPEPILTLEERNSLIDFIAREAKRLGPLMSGNIDAELRALRLGNGQYAEYVDLLGETTRKYREDAKARRQEASVALHNISYYSDRSDPIAFPPNWMAEIPLEIRAAFAPPFYYDSEELSQSTKENLAPFTSQIEDPHLRLLVAHFCGQKEEIEKAVEEFSVAEPPTAEGLLIAASWAFSNDDPEAAGELFLKARILSADPTTRWLIDMGLIKLALTAEPESEIREAGRSAALRILANGTFSGRDRNGFLGVLSALGLRKEATQAQAKLRFPVSSSFGQLSRPIRRPIVLTNPVGLGARAVDLVEAGQAEAATRLVARHLKPLAPGVLTSREPGQFESLQSRLKTKGLIEAVLAESRPKDGAGRLEHVQFATACDVLGDTESAISAYEQLLADEPDDRAIRLRLITLLADKADDRIFPHLRELREREDSSQQLSFFANALDKISDYFRLRIQACFGETGDSLARRVSANQFGRQRRSLLDENNPDQIDWPRLW